ncbi:unnamed protein product, partial [Owenia fusiformis]
PHKTENMDCPICSQTFPVSSLEEHVNECLNVQDKSIPVSDRDEQSNDVIKPAKRQKTSAQSWSFLTRPNKSDSSASSSKDSTKSTTSQNKIHLTKDKQTGKNTSDMNDIGVLTSLKTTPFNDKVNGGKFKHEFVEKTLNTNKHRKHMVNDHVPLAEKMRPLTLDDYVGQDQAVGKNKLLRSLIDAREVPSMIFWGPPGCGKTTLARIISENTKGGNEYRFVKLSATTSGVADVKEAVKHAKNELKMFKRKTILFIDEIHRFNKLQQDTFLPYVEDGTIVLLGATTENPSFQLNTALLSRCRVIVLEKLSTDSINSILKRALRHLGVDLLANVSSVPSESIPLEERPKVYIAQDALDTLACFCDGDGRSALNGLQTVVNSRKAHFNSSCISTPKARSSSDGDKECDVTKGYVIVREDHIKDGLQRSHIHYDRAGEEHYNIMSALHKSIRGSDSNAALYWLARMLEGGEDPLYIARRLVVMACEDIGLSDPGALPQAVATYQACQFTGMPACDCILAQCCVYLARAPKSVEVYCAYMQAKESVKNHKGPLPGVPLHLRNASTKLMKDLGYGKDYKYNPAFKDPVQQDYLPKELLNIDFFKWKM